MALNFDEKKYQVCFGVESYTIALDMKGRVYYLQAGNESPIYRDDILNNSLNPRTLDFALKFLLVAEPAKFIELYMTVYESDPEMFKHFKIAVISVGSYCALLSSVDGNE